MKISPVRSASPAPIPTAAEAAANPALVAPAPAVRPRRGTGALLGAGLLGSLLAPTASGAGFVLVESGSGAQAETPAAAVPPSPAETEAAARAEAARDAVATVVAPILQKAMDEDGRGAFGCVAVDPPVILSENEALNLIEQEFAKAGVKLRDAYELTGFTRTVADKTKKPREEKGRPWCSVYPTKKVPGKWVFDLATEDGSVAVEFLSLSDESRESLDYNCSTVSDTDLPKLAQRLRDDFVTRTEGAPVAIGLFFDPLASTYVWESHGKKHIRPGSALAALTEEELKNLDWQKRRELLQGDARELLREQVRFFLDWARKEGKLPHAEGAESEPHAERAENAEPVPQAESGSPAGGAGERSEPEGVPHAESAENAE